MFSGIIGYNIGQAVALADEGMVKNRRRIEAAAKETMTPEDYTEWKKERDAERRHQELCSAIRDSRVDVKVNSSIF